MKNAPFSYADNAMNLLAPDIASCRPPYLASSQGLNPANRQASKDAARWNQSLEFIGYRLVQRRVCNVFAAIHSKTDPLQLRPDLRLIARPHRWPS